MSQTRVKPMAEGGILAAVAILFALMGVYLPIIGPFINLLWPVPIVLLGVRHGFKWSLLTNIVSGLAIAMLLHPMQALILVVGYGLIGMTLGYAIRHDYSPFKALICGTVISFVSLAGTMVISAQMMGLNPLTAQADLMSQSMDQVVGIYRSMGMGEEMLTQLSQTMNAMIAMMRIMIPAILVLLALMITYLNFTVTRMVLKKLGQPIQAFPPFREWSMPSYVLLAFALGTGAMWYGNYSGQQLLYTVGANFQIVASSLLFVHGLAVFYFLADKYKLSRMSRSIILILIFTNAIFTQALVFGGAFDIAFDYRKLRTAEC